MCPDIGGTRIIVTVRRLLLNFGSRSVDFRVGADALTETSKCAKAIVTVPRRALLVMGEGALDEDQKTELTHGLIDAGFALTEYPIAPQVATSFEQVEPLLNACAHAGICSDDLVVGVGPAPVLALASLVSRLWCGGTGGVQLLQVPTTLDAMVTAATAASPMTTSDTRGFVELRPEPNMVLCDISLLRNADADARAGGYVLLTQAHFVDSRRSWDRFTEDAPRIAAGEDLMLLQALSTSQTARRLVISSANPSSRHALEFGETTARTLRRLLGDEPNWWQLLAEGMRFESRLAVEACGFSADDMFAIDDRLADLGIEELGFTIDPATFVQALREEQAHRSNRQLIALPKMVGTVRLTTVEDDLLQRHAEAYLAMRAEIAQEQASN